MDARTSENRGAQLDYYASLESMEGMAEIAPAPKPEGFLARHPRAKLAYAIYPGLLAAGTIGLAATFLSQHYGAPVMLFALLIGMAFHFLHEEGRCVAGIEFSSRTVLRLGIAFLGARITAGQIAGLGVAPIITVITGVAATLLFGALTSRALGLPRPFGVLSGGAVAICGASAALAISTALPRYAERERDTVLTVVGVTTLSTIAMVIYPMIVVALRLDHNQAGVFLGGAIHDVAQVVGAGYMISQGAGDVATYVKLLRVALLIPVVLGVGWYFARAASGSGGKAPPFPAFLGGFAALVALNSLVALPAWLTGAATTFSAWCLVTAIAALGMKTSLRDLFDVGWKPVGLMIAETLFLGALVLAAIKLAA